MSKKNPKKLTPKKPKNPIRVPTLNLKTKVLLEGISLQNQIELVLDKFLAPFLLSKKPGSVRIITGKGLHSTTFIKGQHQLKHYTESYLVRLGLNFQEAGYFDGQDGVLVVYF